MCKNFATVILNRIDSFTFCFIPMIYLQFIYSTYICEICISYNSVLEDFNIKYFTLRSPRALL